MTFANIRRNATDETRTHFPVAWEPILDTRGLHASGAMMPLTPTCAVSDRRFRPMAAASMAQGRHYTALVVEFDKRYAFIDAAVGLDTWLQPQFRDTFEDDTVKAVHLIAVSNFTQFRRVYSIQKPIEKTRGKLNIFNLMCLFVDANRTSYASDEIRKKAYIARRYLLGCPAVFHNVNSFIMYLKLLIDARQDDPSVLRRLEQFLRNPNVYESVALNFYNSYSVQLILGHFLLAKSQFELAKGHFQRAIDLTASNGPLDVYLAALGACYRADLNRDTAIGMARLSAQFQQLALQSRTQ